MVEIKKKEVTEEKISYYYLIEGKGNWGLLTYFPKKGICRVEEFAQDEDELDNYRNHAFSIMIRFYKNNEYPDYKLIAWY